VAKGLACTVGDGIARPCDSRQFLAVAPPLACSEHAITLKRCSTCWPKWWQAGFQQGNRKRPTPRAFSTLLRKLLPFHILGVLWPGAVFKGPTVITMTPKVLRGVYFMLKQIPPISRWQLPNASSIRFRITRSENDYAEVEPKTRTMWVSRRKHAHLASVEKTVAHEMIHLARYLRGHKRWDEHDKTFLKMSEAVSNALGWDPKDL